MLVLSAFLAFAGDSGIGFTKTMGLESSGRNAYRH